LIRSLFIFDCHEKSILIAIWENISFIFSNFGNFWEFESRFPKRRDTKMQIVELGVLRVSLRIVYIPVLGFCRQNPGRSSIFPEALKIRQKTVFCSFKRRMKFFWVKLNLRFCSRSLWSIKAIKVFSIFKTQGGVGFWSENSATFQRSFLIGRPIRGLRFVLWKQD
jgi:hypothetical protein